jgi:hypothetical protein
MLEVKGRLILGSGGVASASRFSSTDIGQTDRSIARRQALWQLSSPSFFDFPGFFCTFGPYFYKTETRLSPGAVELTAN